MKNFKSCAGFGCLIMFLTLAILAVSIWGALKYGESKTARNLIGTGVALVAVGIIVVYVLIHQNRFLKAVKKERPGAIAFWATAPPNMLHPMGVSLSDIDPHSPASVVVTASPEAFDVWMDMELKAPTRSLPNTTDLKWNRGMYYMGVRFIGSKEDGNYDEEDIFQEAIEIRNPNGDNLIFKTKNLNATEAQLEELRR